MEDKEAIITTGAVAPPPLSLPAKKSRTGVNALRVALFLVRRRSPGKKKEPLHADVVKPGGRGLWKTLLAAVRPLHPHPQLQHTDSVPAAEVVPTAGDSTLHDVPLPTPASPTASEVFSCSDGMSRYASADDLRALDTVESDDVVNGDNGPHEIDVMAEEFIARFYEQMKLQRLESFRHRRMIEEGAY